MCVDRREFVYPVEDSPILPRESPFWPSSKKESPDRPSIATRLGEGRVAPYYKINIYYRDLFSIGEWCQSRGAGRRTTIRVGDRQRDALTSLLEAVRYSPHSHRAIARNSPADWELPQSPQNTPTETNPSTERAVTSPAFASRSTFDFVTVAVRLRSWLIDDSSAEGALSSGSCRGTWPRGSRSGTCGPSGGRRTRR